MPSLTEWKVPPAYQPRPGDYGFDLDRVLSSVVGLHSIIPADAFSADTLGTERAGNGVVIDDGLVLTIGYLITEAEAVWLHLGDGRVVEGHALGFDSVIGSGSVQLEREREGKAEHVNMIVPIDLLKPVLDDLRKFGRVNRPARPWLGMYTTEIDNRIVVIGISAKGPAARAELKTGDVILAVKGEKISSQTAFYRKLWALGSAGVDVPLTVFHDGVTFDVVLTSTDRAKLLKGPRLH